MIGKFVTSKAGHDKNQLYVIIAQEKDIVYLCDGEKKTIEQPKKKNIKHIQIINQKVEEGLLELLEKKEQVQNEQIKYAIKQYIRQKEVEKQEG